MVHLQTELLDQVLELVYTKCSLKFSPSRLINFESQLRERLTARGSCSYEDYLHVLRTDPEELGRFVERITTKETYFFRLAAQFEALRSVALPEIEVRLSLEAMHQMVSNGGPGPWKPPLRIWSAGCATGEEAYTIAMTVLESLRFPRAVNLEILATDLSKQAVATAAIGFYDRSALDKIPARHQGRFVTVMEGGIMMGQDLLDKVAFRVFNLRNLSPDPDQTSRVATTDGAAETLRLFQRFDIIFCRNVMIYFDFTAQQELITNLFACLKPGGYLFTGDAELLNIYEHRFQTVEKDGAIFYRKPEGGQGDNRSGNGNP